MDTADILFVASDPREFKGALRLWQNVRPVALPVYWARTATRKGRPVIAVANGVGWDRAALAVQAAPHRQLCNIGFCGALDPDMQIADIVVSSLHLPVRSAKTHWTGSIASVERIASTAEAKQRLRGEGHIAVEMESAGIHSEPFFCIKAVSDLAGETLLNDYQGALRPDGRTNALHLLAGAMRDPLSRVPELIRLARHTALASERLGEFLDNCEF